MNFGDFSDGGTPAPGDYMVGYRAGGGAGSDRRWLFNALFDTYKVFNVVNYGAIGDGIADDSAARDDAIDAAINNGGGIIYFPAGSFAINSAGTVYQESNIYFMGAGIGATKMLVASAFGDNALQFVECDHVGVSGITFDLGNNLPNDSAVFCQDVDDAFIENNEVLHMGRGGIVWQGGARYWINGNRITKDTPTNADLNEAIQITDALASIDYEIAGNRCTGSGILVSGAYSRIIGNRISGWIYGGGITTEQSTSCHDLVIAHNIINDGGGNDSGVGIEQWAPNTTVAHNTCFRCYGSGIDHGGKNGTVVGNICYDNMQGAFSSAGIIARYGTATYNASGSIFSANRSFNLAGVTQTYGYAEESSSLANIILNGNSFIGNATAATNILSATTSVLGPLVDAVNDAAAQAGGVSVGQVYRNGSVLMVRVA